MAAKTILLADDDRDLVQLLMLRFKQLGVEVFRSPDAMHALFGAQKIHPDLIVLDVNMPGGNGLSVCEMLAGNDELKDVPVIIMTGESNDQTVDRCNALGAFYVQKGPQLWEELREMTCEFLGLTWSGQGDDSESGTNDGHSPAEKESSASYRPKILCIDDDPEISKILKLRLEPYGVDVLRAFNGMQGYWTAMDMNPDVIITDLSMPDGEGNYIMGRLKSRTATEKVPVIVLTGQSNPSTRRLMLSIGADAYLMKPLNLPELLSELSRHIKLKEPKSLEVLNLTEPAPTP